MSTPSRYSRLSISLHWLTLLLIIVVYAMAELKGFFPKESATGAAMRMLHSSCGLTILALTLLRLASRPFQRTPAITPQPAAWESLAARLMHAALYALLIVLPLLAWFGISAYGSNPAVWGIPLPALTGEDKALGSTLFDAHKLIANIGYGLIALHTLAALKHHYINRDNALQRMLPARG